MQFEKPGPVERDLSEAISPIEEIIDEARNGGAVNPEIDTLARHVARLAVAGAV